MKPFTLIGVDGNAFAIMGYTAKALRRAGLVDRIEEMRREATSDDYFHLVQVCDRYVEYANEALGLVDDEDEEDD